MRIRFCDPKNSIQIIEVKPNALLSDLVEQLKLTQPQQAVAVTVNDSLKDFSYPLQENDLVQFFSFDTPQGKDVFWHSSAHVLAQAVLRLFPNAKPTIGPPIENGFYYDFANLTISEEDLEKIEEEMQKICEENYKTERYQFSSKEEAMKRFQNNPYKVELIQGL